MPYHLLERPQKTKDILFQTSEVEHYDTRNRLRRSATRAPFIAAQTASSGHLVARVPPPHPISASRSTPRTSPWLTVILPLFVIVVLACAIYLAYTRIQSAIFGPRHSRNHKKLMSPAGFAASRGTHDHDNLGRGASNRSFGLNKRRKPPPPSLDLEALKPQKGIKRGWWDSMPSIVPGRGNASTPSYPKSRDDGDSKSAGGSGSGSGSAWTSGSAYSAGAGARLIAEMVPEGLNSAVKDSIWGSRESLLSRILGDRDDESVLPVAADREDQALMLAKYFEHGGVGIKAEDV
ncbi:MAG: hypothetical protein Q9211_000927 [Gyalolechia sp. 1 TL-2023]